MDFKLLFVLSVPILILSVCIWRMTTSIIKTKEEIAGDGGRAPLSRDRIFLAGVVVGVLMSRPCGCEDTNCAGSSDSGSSGCD